MSASSDDRKCAKVNCMVDHHEIIPNNKPNQILFHLHKHERFHETNKGNMNKAKAIQSSLQARSLGMSKGSRLL